MAQGCLTVRPTSRAGTKVEHSDPVVPYGRAIAQRIKGTPVLRGASTQAVVNANLMCEYEEDLGISKIAYVP